MTTNVETSQGTWQEELLELLQQAAKLSADNGCNLNSFLSAASTSFLTANPKVREHLEELQLRAQLEHARQNGQIAQA